MKKTILLTLTLIISYASIGQNLSTVGGKLIVKGSIDNGDKLRFFDLGDKTNEVLRLNSLGDTLEIKSPIVKFIKIDGKVYEIKRNTELKEVVDNYGFKSKLPTTIWYTDTSYYFPIKPIKK